VAQSDPLAEDDAMMAKPYSPQTLADRWGCSAEKIRTMYRNGELAGFELGKLIRIPAAEVERYECQNIPSPCTEISGRSPSEMVNVAAESRLARITAPRPNLSPVLSGTGSTHRKANG
jgi:excisionase family DNA binding protein